MSSNSTFQHTHARTHTYRQPFYGSLDFVRDNLGEPAPEETFILSHQLWSSTIPYLLLPSITIHSILSAQFTCLFPQSLSKFSLVYLLAWHPPLHTPFISSPNHCHLFAAHAHTIATCFAVVSRLHTYIHTFNGLFSRTTWVSRHQKGKPFWILLQQKMMGWQWHQLDYMQIICTTLQTTTPVPHHSIFYGPDALPDAQPTVSKHWRHTVVVVSTIEIMSSKPSLSLNPLLGTLSCSLMPPLLLQFHIPNTWIMLTLI